jgi:hypothetical protein
MCFDLLSWSRWSVEKLPNTWSRLPIRCNRSPDQVWPESYLTWWPKLNLVCFCLVAARCSLAAEDVEATLSACRDDCDVDVSGTLSAAAAIQHEEKRERYTRHLVNPRPGYSRDPDVAEISGLLGIQALSRFGVHVELIVCSGYGYIRDLFYAQDPCYVRTLDPRYICASVYPGSHPGLVCVYSPGTCVHPGPVYTLNPGRGPCASPRA